MTFNIRKLKIQIDCTKRELRTCDPRSRDRLRLKLKRQERALEIAKEARALQRVAA
jgi:hypothetical protein